MTSEHFVSVLEGLRERQPFQVFTPGRRHWAFRPRCFRFLANPLPALPCRTRFPLWL